MKKFKQTNLKVEEKSLCQKGFTLIEVMIAMVLISIGFLAMSTLQVTSVNKNASSSIITGSTTWATAQIEDIFSWDYSDTRLIDDGDPATAEGTLNSSNGVYSLSWFVTQDTPIANTKNIDVIVTWTRMGETQTTNFSSVIPQQ